MRLRRVVAAGLLLSAFHFSATAQPAGFELQLAAGAARSLGSVYGGFTGNGTW